MAEKKYIPLDAAQDVLCEFCIGSELCDQNSCRAASALNTIPASDVVERKKGEWALVEKRRKASVYRCSECGNFFTVWPDTLNCGRGDMNYCPNCGADMRPEPPKEEKEEMK